jgi:hypothetical protein
MADFAAVLKKTIDAQANPTPELRQRVYDKARATIEQKLAAANAPAAVATRQRKALEDAIAELEAQYAQASRPAAPRAQEVGSAPEAKPAPRPVPPTPAPAIPKPAVARPRSEPAAPVSPPAPRAPSRVPPKVAEPTHHDPLEDFINEVQPAERAASRAQPARAARKPARGEEPALSYDEDEWQQDREQEEDFARAPAYEVEEKRGGLGKTIIFGLIALLVLGGGGYAAWSNKEQLQSYVTNLVAQFDSEKEAAVQPAPAPATPPAKTPAPASRQPAENSAQQPQAPAKLTQRLMPDGSEIDPGPAGDQPGVGEGTSVAEATSQPAAQPPASTPAQATLPVGQQAFFYEERSGQEAGSAKKGTVVWSVVQESPGEGEPAEPAIRADVTIPENNIRLRMTIRRNTDKSLPASHLVEMIFSVPQNFPGGAIDNVQRVTFKDTEQSAGSPLIAIPNKIADNLFIVALNDARTAIDTNMTLMRRQQWIDIPITYRTGRRALITVEKGVPGDKVFNDVLRAWGVGG